MIVYGNVSIESWSRFFRDNGIFPGGQRGVGVKVGGGGGRGEGGGEEIHHINNREAKATESINNTPRGDQSGCSWSVFDHNRYHLCSSIPTYSSTG